MATETHHNDNNNETGVVVITELDQSRLEEWFDHLAEGNLHTNEDGPISLPGLLFII